jgi:hypothetical protein
MTKITEIRFEITYNENIWDVIRELQNVAENFPDAVFRQVDNLNDLIFDIPNYNKELKQND